MKTGVDVDRSKARFTHRNRIAIVPMVRGLLLVLLASSSVSAPGRSLEDIRASGELRLCIAGSSAPFYHANGEAFARFLHVKTVVRRLVTFDEQFHNAQGRTEEAESYEPRLLSDGTCDVYPNDLHIVPWRETKMRIVPYYTVRKVIVARPELRTTVRNQEDLGGLTAAVQDGTSYRSWLSQLNADKLKSNPVKIILRPTADSLELVASGLADFTVLGTEGVLKWVHSDPTRLSILFAVDQPVQVGWGVQQSAQSLATELQRFFDESARDGSELDENWRQYYVIHLTSYRLFQKSLASNGIDLKTILAWTTPIATVLLTLVAALLAWSLRNVKRHRKAIEATIDAIAATAESRDPYTAGHQRRVAQLATAIAREMKLPSARIEGLHFGALIHDLGKIRVPDELLCKPTHLTAAEFEVIKMHPVVGYEIVQDIAFPWPVAQIIRQHHERMDGTGYPDGLKGEQILLEARILAVADVVEAMAFRRPYRPGLGIKVALSEIERGRGHIYDPEVVQACLRVFQAGYSLVDAE